MTNYNAPAEQQWAADQNRLLQRVAVLERRVAQLTSGPVAVTSTTHPPSPYAGMPIYETDTGLNAFWNGTAWQYPPQVLWNQTLGSPASSVSSPTLPSVFNFLRLEFWVHRASGGPTDLTMQVDGVSSSNYLWAKMESLSATQGNSHAGAATTAMKIGALGGTTSAYFSSGSVGIGGWKSSAGYLATSGTSALFDTNTVDYLDLTGSLFAGTGPHSSLTIAPLAGSLAAGSQFLLWGIG